MPGPRTDTPATTPPLSLLFGYGPMLPILAAGIAALAGWEWAIEAGRLWSASILIFLGGVTRGLSFFTAGGPRLPQIGIMLLRFVLGLSALVLPSVLAFAALLAGYASVPLYDVQAAHHGTAPRYFARLRWPQMGLALIGLALLLAASLQAN
ncbi:DUF3429 domain-containing protein [Altericroceibacterium xinjiangense]|uniref:DUF3429 domain-containing protein n=1 Tax=Altericroceibacterium xinjiangense TaxID=762261 RepID=UPI000F7E23F7|nr:DUF3429 domain-containing protein [Altericroceibacterium xinjiangense]